jgi:hypothetical protein
VVWIGLCLEMEVADDFNTHQNVDTIERSITINCANTPSPTLIPTLQPTFVPSSAPTASPAYQEDMSNGNNTN